MLIKYYKRWINCKIFWKIYNECMIEKVNFRRNDLCFLRGFGCRTGRDVLAYGRRTLPGREKGMENKVMKFYSKAGE